MRVKKPPPFFQSCSEKGVETVEGGVAPKNLVTTHNGFAAFTPFFQSL